MLLLNIAAKKLLIIIHHFKGGVPQATSKRKWIFTVQSIKYSHCMPERVRGDSDADNACHATIGLHFVLQGACTNLFITILGKLQFLTLGI